jgi:hypothetical protein
LVRNEFFAGCCVAVLATDDPDGSAYLAAVRFEFVDGAFLVPTGGRSRKGRNALARSCGSMAVKERGGTCTDLGVYRTQNPCIVDRVGAQRTAAKASIARRRSASSWAADIWVRMRAAPIGTTG